MDYWKAVCFILPLLQSHMMTESFGGKYLVICMAFDALVVVINLCMSHCQFISYITAVIVRTQSDLIATTTAGGSVTLTCIRSTGNHEVRWLIYTLGNEGYTNIMNIDFSHERPHISSNTSSHSYSENEVAFSITLSNLKVTDNNSLVTCEVGDSDQSCSLLPIVPFMLQILPLLPVNKLPTDVPCTPPPQIDGPNASLPPLRPLPPSVDTQKETCPSVYLPLLIFIGAEVFTAVMIGLVIWCCYKLYGSKDARDKDTATAKRSSSSKAETEEKE